MTVLDMSRTASIHPRSLAHVGPVTKELDLGAKLKGRHVRSTSEPL